MGEPVGKPAYIMGTCVKSLTQPQYVEKAPTNLHEERPELTYLQKEPLHLTYLEEDPSTPSPSLPPSRPSLHTQILDPPPLHSRRQRPPTSGRFSAEPQEYFVSQHLHSFSSSGASLRPVTSISELDLRNIDPDTAASLLQQIESGADMEPILLQLKNSQARDAVGGRGRADKMVTFEEDRGGAGGAWDKGCV